MRPTIMRIAVLGDDPILLDPIKGPLERHHHLCHTCASGTRLLKDVRHETFDLLTVDWHLPDMEATAVLSNGVALGYAASTFTPSELVSP